MTLKRLVSDRSWLIYNLNCFCFYESLIGSYKLLATVFKFKPKGNHSAIEIYPYKLRLENSFYFYFKDFTRKYLKNLSFSVSYSILISVIGIQIFKSFSSVRYRLQAMWNIHSEV